MTPSIILYAEDEPSDIFFLERAFKLAVVPYQLKSVPDGQQAIQYLAGTASFADRELYPLPSLVLLDINMPKRSGLEVLEWLRQQPSLSAMPVVMLTSSLHPQDMEKSRQLAADDYILKPSDPLQLVEFVKSIESRWLSGPRSIKIEQSRFDVPILM